MMIEFSGKMSDDSQKLILKANKRIATIGMLIACLLFLIPILIGAFIWNWLILLLIIPMPFLVLLAGISPKDLNRVVPESIYIDEKDMVAESQLFRVVKSVSDVKRVVDNGKCYQIFFHSMPFCPNFVCQKNLISKGTIEEFELLFEGKLVKAGDSGLS
ncbi:MAG: hypothetical protein J6C61_05430 [Clostridia bacterium]|nr:hypothetical protein [Clostridia bacterium]